MRVVITSGKKHIVHLFDSKHNVVGRRVFSGINAAKLYARNIRGVKSITHVGATFTKTIRNKSNRIKVGRAFRPTANMARSAVRAGFVIGKKAMRG